jgi:simple sugar transport system permease protein
MLVYVADQVLGYLVYGPWKDPAGTTFRRRSLSEVDADPEALPGYRVNIGLVIALLAVGAFWILLFRTYAGLPAAGRRPGAGGGALRRLLVAQGAVDGAAALGRHGRAGRRARGRRAARPAHAARAGGYGFAAIIVAFVGRLHPVGVVFSAILMSMFYIGGELAQSRLGLPKSLTGVFQGLLLFTLLACDTLIHYRLRWQSAPAPAAATTAAPAAGTAAT